VGDAVIVALGNGLIVTVVLDDAEHEFAFVTVTETVTIPDAPAVYVILLVDILDVIVPLLTVHEYVAPTPASGTEAALPVELEHTDAALVIVALGNGLIVTDAPDDAEHEFALVTVTESVVVPDAPAVYVILLVDVLDVIVPLVTVHA
jgi:hypothetical protein